MVGAPPNDQQSAFQAAETQDRRAPGSWQQDLPSEVPPEITARYEILRRLGRGASGIVYQVRDRDTGECVAIKLLRPELAADPTAMERFKNELRLARKITHPNVCRIYEFQRAGNTAFISMEAVEGESLRSLLGRRRKLPWQEALPLVDSICEGLEAAHRRGIVHRDLKPENVMVSSEGQVKVMDFGIAHTTRSDVSVHGAIIGTPLYMSPEQALGQPVGLGADIYALGLILYEALCGVHPLYAETGLAAMLRQIKDEPPPLTDYESSVPPAIEQIVLKCLEKKPEQRFAALTDLRAALREAAAVPAPPPVQRLKPMALAAAVLVLAAGALWLPLRGRITHAMSRPILVVLPCSETPGGANERAYCDGVVETLSARLGKIPGLNVIPSREVFDRRVKTARAAREELGATLVLTASWQRSGSQARIHVDLASTDGSQAVRGDTITASMGDLFALQDTVVADAAHILNVKADVNVPRSSGPENQGAAKPAGQVYDFYIQGRGYLQEYDKPENISSAIVLFQEAVKQDPQFALAYAGLAEADMQRFRITREGKWLDEARSSCEKAVALDGSLPEGQVCLGQALSAKGQYEEAVAHFRLALARAPDSDVAYRGLGDAYSRLNRFPDAEIAFRQAIAEHPQYAAGYSWLGAFYMGRSCYAQAADEFWNVVRLAPDSFRGYSNLGAALVSAGDYTEAVRVLEKSLSIRPNDAGLNNLGVADLALSRFPEAAGVFQQALSFGPRRYLIWGNLGQARYFAPGLRPQAATAYRQALALAQQEFRTNPRDPKVAVNLARYSARLGDAGAARSYLTQALALGPNNASVLLTAALTKVQLGDQEGALDLIARSFEAGESLSDVRDTPDFDPLHDNPRFQELLRKQSRPTQGGQTCRLTTAEKL